MRTAIDKNNAVGVAMIATVMVAIIFLGDSIIVDAKKSDVMPIFEYRTIDGTDNNEDNPSWGSAGSKLLRISGSEYSDGISAPAGPSRLSPREISNMVVAQTESIPNTKASDFVWQWGQFVDHDMDLTPPAIPCESFNIPVPGDDSFFVPFSVIKLCRSLHDGGNPRQQINVITAFIDASNVYGSDTVTAAALRTFMGGKLKTSSGDFLPIDANGFFIAGDVRVNEQIDLTAMHTLFVREHNRLAEKISTKHPSMSDEEIYQTVRKIVGAEIQVITYKEFLPIVLGRDAIPPYEGYDPQVNSGIANEFSAASFRFGHSLLSPNLLRIKNSGEPVSVPLRNAFFNPGLLYIDDGIDSIMRGLAGQPAQELDNKIVDDVRNFLFGPPGSGGFDLASLNIQRGREHGLPDYNSVRVAYGLPVVTSFDQISSDPVVQTGLLSAYTSVDEIDLWVGGLAEDHAPGAMVGETIQKVLSDQFIRLRDGDRFWYENDPFFKYHEDLMKEVKKTTLADIIRDNTSIDDDDDELRDNVFRCKVVKSVPSDQKYRCR